VGAAEIPRRSTQPQSLETLLNFIWRGLAGCGWVLADLDGDHEPDVAGGVRLGRTKDGYVYNVQIRLSRDASSNSFPVFHNNALGLRITGLDIDGDNDIDLIISDRFFGQHRHLAQRRQRTFRQESPRPLRS